MAMVGHMNLHWIVESDEERSLGFSFLLPFLSIAYSLGVFLERENVKKSLMRRGLRFFSCDVFFFLIVFFFFIYIYTITTKRC